ncbi:unnamed protein product [Durusdinium trenchii]|uniref:Uncharacterized protein n=1 Tax=Durusdinium trenchii TaxID=1381693 RepID=A0ABP0RE89_9DINO
MVVVLSNAGPTVLEQAFRMAYFGRIDLQDEAPSIVPGIFAKYKESEAALYRALCDKYLPTLAQDGEPLEFDVWGQSDAESIQESHEERIQLVSPSQDCQPLEPNGRTLPSGGNVEERANQPGAAAEAFPPALPRATSGENIAGVNESAGHADRANHAHRSTTAALKPKPAARPRRSNAAESSAEDQPHVLPTSQGSQGNRREGLQGEAGSVQDAAKGPDGRQRKKRRKASAKGREDLQVGSLPSQQALASSNLEERRQHLKEKLLELKTQISTQVPNKEKSLLVGQPLMLSTWTAGQAHSADPGKQSTEPMAQHFGVLPLVG